jgi:hypothetical protein
VSTQPVQKIQILLVASFLFACNTAQAMVVNFQFSGTVNASNLAVVGDTVTGAFSYDTSTVPISSTDNAPGTSTVYFIDRPNALNVAFGAYTITSDRLSITVTNNLNSNTPDSFSLGTVNMQLDGVDKPDAYFALTLGTYPLDPTAFKAIKSSKLPSSLNVNDFSIFYNDGIYGSDRTGAALDFLGFDIDSITSDAPPAAIPLPTPVILFAPALLGFLGLRRKPKAA